MNGEATGYLNRLQHAWWNVQANRQVRPADLMNGIRFVHPLRSLAAGQRNHLGLAQLAMDVFTRFKIKYEPCTGKSFALPRQTIPTRHLRSECRVGLFVDSPDHLSGVAMTLAEWNSQALLRGKSLTVHTCTATPQPDSRVTFSPMGSISLGVYEGLALHVPCIGDVLSYISRMDFDAIHISTPGPMGLLGLLAARERGLPVCGTYHTDFPRYARDLTGDAALEDACWRYMLWFYGQMDRVAAPTESVRAELVSRGIDAARISVVGRGVDTTRFSPARRDPEWRRIWARGHSLVLFYAGRLSREKNLETLTNAFLQLRKTRPDICLVVAGDGPYRKEMEQALCGSPAYFTGVLSGDQLSTAYASSDLFVFPSQTDTFGRVVLEAQASGLPVVVSSDGGPKHAMLDRQTGCVINEIDAVRLAETVDRMTNDPALMARYGKAAIRFARSMSLDASFDAFWKLHQFDSRHEAQSGRRVMT